MVTGTLMAGAQSRAEREARLKIYGLETCVDNPVFTIPPHEMSEADQERAGLAGVCRNDGVAYTDDFLELGREWHFAPKLDYCREELDVLKKVVCAPLIDQSNINAMALKVMAWKTANCGAVVVYRMFAYGCDHFVASYDNRGSLLDAMFLNGGNEMDELFKAENKGGFKNTNFSADATLKRTDGNHFFVNHRKMYDKQKSGGATSSATAELREYFSVNNAGHFVRDSLVKDAEFPAVNRKAMELFELRECPLSAKDYMLRHCRMATALKGTSQELSFMRWNFMKVMSEPVAFLGWCKRNPKSSAPIAYYLNMVRDNEDAEMRMSAIEKALRELPTDARAYWIRKLDID